jgi:hypothetical protein
MVFAIVQRWGRRDEQRERNHKRRPFLNSAITLK